MSPWPATAAATTRTREGARRGGHSPRVARRVSGAVRPRPVLSGGAVALPRPVGPPPPLRRALRRLAALPDHRLLARLVHGSAWIGIVGFALIGIVFMQVSLLKLNAGIGRSVEKAAILDRQNAELRAAVSELGSNDRIQAEAQRLGLVVPPAGSVTFLGRHGHRIGGDAPAALAVGTATQPQPAGTGAGATAPTTAAAAPPAAATSTTPPPSAPAAAAPPASTQAAPAASATPPPSTPQSAQPPATGTAAGGATPVAAQQP